jgi:outer membrane receptor protein involved in Fe transport
MAMSAPAMAQDPSGSEAAKTLDTVSVTGTRLKSQSMTASSPVAEISKEAFQYSGATKVEDLVNQYPQLSNTFDSFSNNGSVGYATVDLRGLGAQRTLTLVNGRRIPKGTSETPDISIIPAALVNRVDLLTGGASAVYGSDAVAGVVNFMLDDTFEGVSVNMGYSAYQHDNSNSLMQGLMDKAGYDYPTGDSGFDGIARNIDLAIGGAFGESGHAIAWATWRENDALLQGQRDYSSCALSRAGTACGGSATADPANFYVVTSAGGFYVAPSTSGTWSRPAGPYLYNYAPVNYYQRPDTRYTAGTSIKYQVNEHFEPYLETMFVNHHSSTQIAPSGAFFTDVTVNCNTAVIGSMCSDVGITDDEFTVYVAKRNVEGGPRITNTDTNSFSITGGARGSIVGNWSYDASFSYNRSSTRSESINDFVTTRVQDALLGCPSGSFDGCVPYSVWTDSVTAAEAEALQGVGIVNYLTTMRVLNAYVTGDFGYGLPWAGEAHPISLVAGVETRAETYERIADTNMQTGNFTGLGGPTTNVSGDTKVKELFLEGGIPLVADLGSLNLLDLQLGYRYSDYNTSGSVNTYKAGLGAAFFDGKLKLRGGWNRAIRAPNIGELYQANSIGLWSGNDPCAGSSPDYTAAQCANTGVTAAQYGNIAENPAGQYNEVGGGNTALKPETANTWTFGFAVTPIRNLDISVDYYDIKIEDAIQAVGSDNILTSCALTGNAEMCGLVRRNAVTGDLFRGSDVNSSGLIYNSLRNIGGMHIQGIDLTAAYAWNIGSGRLSTTLMGSYVIKKEYEPLPGMSELNYDCAGVISTSCSTPEWRHIANARYSFDRYSVGLRWRYIGKLDYPGTTDVRLVNQGNQVAAYNYFDLSGSVELGDHVTWTVGVNNIADKEPPLVGGTVTYNGNSLRGYDQAGRYIFTSLGLRF